MRLEKTDKAKGELKPGVRTLGRRQRALLLVDGKKTLDELAKYVQGDIQALASQLVRDGYLLDARPLIEVDRPATSGKDLVEGQKLGRLQTSVDYSTIRFKPQLPLYFKRHVLQY